MTKKQIKTKTLPNELADGPAAPKCGTSNEVSMNDKLAPIARQHLDIETLEPRHSDSLDFHEVGVWGVRRALEAAYHAGIASVRDAR